MSSRGGCRPHELYGDKLLITLRFWDALQRPPLQHPMFRRTMRLYKPVDRPITKRPLSARLGLALMAFSVVSCGVIAPQLVLFLLLTMPVILSVGFTMLHGTMAGALFATRISSAIARERERGSLNLIAVSPRGGFEALWAICTGCQYYNQWFRGEGNQNVWYTRLILLVVLLVSGTLALSDPRISDGNHTAALFALMITIVMIGFVFVVDDIHSAVIGSLVGLIVPMIARSRFDARLWAFLVFLSLQVFAYLLSWIGSFILAPFLLDGLRLGWVAAHLALPLAQFLIFFATRELIARALWVALVLLNRHELPVMQ